MRIFADVEAVKGYLDERISVTATRRGLTTMQREKARLDGEIYAYKDALEMLNQIDPSYKRIAPKDSALFTVYSMEEIEANDPFTQRRP